MTKLETLLTEGTVIFEKFRHMDNFLEECEHNNLEVNITTDEDNWYVVTLKQ